MIQSIREELQAHILDKISDGVLTNENKDEWHQLAFNEDYYIIGRYQAKEWLKSHDFCVFEAIAEIVEYETQNYGEIVTDVSEPEHVVNTLTYIYGEEVMHEYSPDTIGELWDNMGGDEGECPEPDEEDEEDEEDEDED